MELARTRFHLAPEALQFVDHTRSAIVLGDSDELRAAVWNLLDNAVKYSPAGVSINVAVEEVESGRVAVRVTDRGVGISPVELKRIFRGGRQGDGHGFNFIDKAQLAASGFAATYYAWDARPGMRFISLDTVSEGGVAGSDVSVRTAVSDRKLRGNLHGASKCFGVGVFRADRLPSR